ncbi:sulfotransferase protein [Spatholobus suberectus]|nr:sulfotransferase protein [Spatholobus suberectus]
METKDSPDIKSFKKFPLTLRLVVLVVAVVCGIYIGTICLEQKGLRTSINLLDITVFKQPCSRPSGVQEWELPYLHYPEPQNYSREECACNPVLFFCIVSMQRSGSGWFETFLNSHINVSSNGEIFSVGKRRANVSSILETMDTVYNLDWFSSASKNECSAAVGFKWMLNQGLMEHHEEIEEYFERRRVSIIFLFRRNLLRRMISVLANSYDKDAKPLNGSHKSHVHSASEAKILAKYRPRINVTLLITELKLTKETAAKAITYFKNTRHIVLYYEDLVNNRTKLKDVQEFLRVPHRDLESRQVKIHTAPLSKQIENWDEVQKALTGTPYQSFLHKD